MPLPARAAPLHSCVCVCFYQLTVQVTAKHIVGFLLQNAMTDSKKAAVIARDASIPEQTRAQPRAPKSRSLELSTERSKSDFETKSEIEALGLSEGSASAGAPENDGSAAHSTATDIETATDRPDDADKKPKSCCEEEIVCPCCLSQHTVIDNICFVCGISLES